MTNAQTPTRDWPKIAEYRDAEHAPWSKRTILQEVGKYRLMHKTAGYECAGAMARWTSEGWGVLFDLAGATQGQWFLSEAEARERLAKWAS